MSSNAESSKDAIRNLSCKVCNMTSQHLPDDISLKKCKRCLLATYCSRECQLSDWRLHKPDCRDPTAPLVLIVALGDSRDIFREVASHLIDGLRKFATVTIPTKLEDVQKYMKEGMLRAVVLTDDGIIQLKAFQSFRAELVAYVKSGGVLIMGGTFARFVRHSKFEAFIHDSFRLLWKMGSYHRAVAQLNKSAIADQRLKEDQRLSAAYSQKAMYLKDVVEGDKVYIPNAVSRVLHTSQLCLPVRVDSTEAPVCWAKVGEGWLGYIGDVNCEEESTVVTLVMCNLA